MNSLIWFMGLARLYNTILLEADENVCSFEEDRTEQKANKDFLWSFPLSISHDRSWGQYTAPENTDI